MEFNVEDHQQWLLYMYNSMSTLNIILEFCTGQKMRLLGINRSNDSPSNQRYKIKHLRVFIMKIRNQFQ